AARDERELRRGVLAYERLEVAPQPVLELAALQRLQLHPHSAQRFVEAAAEECDRVVEVVRVDTLDAELLRETRVEAEERLMRDAAAQARIDLRVDRARIDHPVEEPHRGAVGEPLELRDRVRRLAPQL